jgi:uncharacterized protein
MMASSIFLDTNGWLALLNRTDNMHAQAKVAWVDIVRGMHPLILTDWVVAETGNGLARSKDKAILAEALERILQVPRNQLVSIDEALLREALSLFSQHADKSWGLVDCASFIVMRAHGITEAFTSDHDFEQAGFRSLLTT